MNNEKQSSSSAFVQYVINRCSNDKDTGFRAVMRRADNPNQCSAAWEYLVPFCDLASAHQRLSFALIGAAIAREKPEHDGTNGVGEALLKLCNGDKDAKKRELNPPAPSDCMRYHSGTHPCSPADFAVYSKQRGNALLRTSPQRTPLLESA